VRKSAIWAAAVVLLCGARIARAESVSRGNPGNGSLESGVSFPARGEGLVTYSRLGNLLGRQYVHSSVRDTVLRAFASLHAAKPERIFVLGETGFKSGGRIRPHRTHQNGLSVDLFMPVFNGEGRAVPMPTAPWNKFGYSLDFDSRGRRGDLSIDFESVAELLVELDEQARLHGLVVARVIVAPEYIGRILAAERVGGVARLAASFMRTAAWVRHDEHIHVDFRVATPSETRVVQESDTVQQ
jgi:penicillin-insensitive murein DD-endopeptidase